jgi:hypothetical protein
MRIFALATLLLLCPPGPARAQTNAPARPPANAPELQALSILTMDQQLEYANARAKALADDPALNAENEALKKQYAEVMAHGKPPEQQAMMEKVDSHRQKLRAAMLKEDPNLGPIFAKIDKQISETKATKGTAPAQ